MCEAHFTLAQPIYHRAAISYLRSKYFTLRSQHIYRGVAQPPARFFGQQHRSAAGGGCSEVLLAQRSKSFAAPRRKRFRAPQEGNTEAPPVADAARCCWRSGRNCAPLQGAGNFGHRKRETPKRRRWWMQRGVVGAAVEMARRSKALAISGTARGRAKQREHLCSNHESLFTYN